MRFDAPIVLLLAPLVAGAVWFGAAWARRVRIARAGRWSPDAARQAVTAGRFGATTLSLAAFCGAVALAGPRWGSDRIRSRSRGLDLVLAVDISRSMLAQDEGGASRLARAVREARRLVQDEAGDRVGLVAFAGAAYVMSPLTLDGGAIGMYLETLDPDVASAGGTALAPALQAGGALLGAADDAADRVLVVFTDGEIHDTLPDVVARARALAAQGVRLILVGEGGTTPAHIPLRDDAGRVTGWQRDADSTVISTWRRDDVLAAVADAAEGSVVAAALPDQAGAVREVLAGYRRAATSDTRAERGVPRGWLFALAAAALLLLQGATRRTASLIGLVALLGGAGASRAAAQASRPRSAGERAWDRGDTARARRAYAAELVRRPNDTTSFNAGAAALAAGDLDGARQALAGAATSLDPGLRFRALYNLGVVELRAARTDSAARDTHLAAAVQDYREALLLEPWHLGAKWNLELATRLRSGGSGSGGANPQAGGATGGGAGGGSSGAGAGGAAGRRALSPGEAEQLLRSIAQQEIAARRDQNGRERRALPPDVKDW